MSYSLALGVVGGIIGSVVPVIGTQIGFAVGAAIGGYIDTVSTKVTNEGPRLADKTIQTSDEGQMLCLLDGTMRFPGTVVWSTDLIEVQTSAHSGGKGSPSITNNTYNYVVSFLVLLGQGEIAGIRRIWANKQLIYSIGDDADAPTLIASASFAKSVLVLTGSDTQMPPALIESYVGVGNCPGYRNRFGILFENFSVGGTLGNHLPQIECEVVASATEVITHKTVCSLGVGDPGYYQLRGRSWITNRKIYLWRNVGSAYNTGHIALFSSFDGQEKEVIAADLLIPEQTSWELLPVNTRDRFLFSTVRQMPDPLHPSDTFQRLYVIDPLLAFTTEDDGRRFVDFGKITSGYTQAGGGDELTAYDQDTDIIAYAHRSQNSNYFAERIQFFKSGRTVYTDGPAGPAQSGETGAGSIGNYVIRSVATTSSTVVCALACANGLVYAMIYNSVDGKMHLLLLSQTDGSLVSDFVGPAIAPDYGTNILESICVDGNVVRAFADSVNTVWRWNADGTFDILTTGANFQRDDGTFTDLLGGQQCYIGDDHLIMQSNVLANADSSSPIFRHQLVHWNATQPTDVLLSTIVQTECDFRGLTCDVTSLAGVKVHGYLVTKQMASRSVIEFLASVYRFDAVEVAGVLVFVLRGGDPVRTLTLDDLGAHEYGSDSPDPITIQRKQETDLPQAVTVNFTNKDNAYQPGSVTAHRLNTTSEQTVTLDVTALALTSAEASKIADVSMMEAWVNRDAFKWATSYRHEDLVPTDVVMLNGGDALYRVRITKRTDKGGLLEFEGVADDPFITTSAATSNNGATPTLISVSSITTLEVLDIPMLRDSDNYLGGYAAVDANAGWPGAVFQKSNDDVSFETVSQFATKTIIGSTTSVLAAPVAGNTFDGVSTVQVYIGTDTLSSYSRDVVLAGNAPAYLIGNEIVYACTATLVSTGVYALSNLLRGLRGTERFKATHASGERFVVLQTAGMRKLSDDVSDLNVARYYRAVTLGREASTADEVTLRDTGQALAPFAPVDLRVDYTTSPITLSWHRRSRFSGRFLATMQPALGETVEKYETDIKDSTGALLATLASISPSVGIPTYTAGYTATVYQLSATVGRGQGTTITL